MTAAGWPAKGAASAGTFAAVFSASDPSVVDFTAVSTDDSESLLDLLTEDGPSATFQPPPPSSWPLHRPPLLCCGLVLVLLLLTVLAVEGALRVLAVDWHRLGAVGAMWANVNTTSAQGGHWRRRDPAVPAPLAASPNSVQAPTPASFLPTYFLRPPPSSDALLSPAAQETTWLLTGRRNAAQLLQARCNASALRPIAHLPAALPAALQRLTATALHLRPAVQRQLWLGDCRTHLPCLSPDWQTRRLHPRTESDDEPLARLLSSPDWMAGWMQLWHTMPSSDTLFHHLSPNASQDAQHSRAVIPGEPAEEQQLAWQWQTEVYARQHPLDCSNASLFLMDDFYELGGFGSWSHARAAAFALGVRAGRLVVEMEGTRQYSHAYSDCTRRKGLGGCDILLRTSHCPVPDNWQALLNQDRQRFQASHSSWAGGSLQQHLEYLRDRRLLAYSEVRDEMQWTELHHSNVKGWDRTQLREQLPSSLDAYRLMPECWWNRQALSYLMRMTRPAEERLLSLVAQSLQLPQPAVSASNVLSYADALVAANHTGHWWVAIHALKVEWQLGQLAPGLTAALRGVANSSVDGVRHCEVTAGGNATAESSEARTPLLGYAFIRHGDKVTEATLFNDSDYLSIVEKTARNHGLRAWYVGSDHLLTPQRVVASAGALTLSSPSSNTSIPLLQLFSSSLLDAIPDKEHHPLAAGFDWKTSEALNDTDREGIVWRTLLEFGVAQVADVFVSVWTSNHPRMAYELATAASETGSTAPLIRLSSGDEELLHKRC